MHSKSCANVVKQLMKLLITDGVSEPSARSNIVWLAGEFHPLLVEANPDILRVLSISFAEESADTRMQILNLAIKLSLLLPDDEKVQLLATYVLEMARYDPDTDVRDRSRLMTALMGLAPSTADADGNDVSTVDEDALAVFSEHAAKIMLAGKLPPVTAMVTAFDSDGSSDYYVGSLSSVVNHNAVAYIHIAAWAEVMVPSVRDGVDGSGADFLPGHGHHPTSVSGTVDDNFDARKFYEGDESSDGSRSDDSDEDSDDDSEKSDGSQGSDSSTGSHDTSSDSSSSSVDDDESSSSSSSEDEDSSVDRSVPRPGARKTPSRPVGPVNSNNNSNRLTQATTASSSINMTGSRSVVNNAGMKKVAKSTVTAASSSSGKAAVSSRSAAVGQSFDLLSMEPLYVAPANSPDLIGGSLNAPLDLMNGWSTGNSEPIAMNSMQPMSAMNNMQGNAMNNMQGNAMNNMQGNPINYMQGNLINNMQGNAMNTMQGNAMNTMQGNSSVIGMSSNGQGFNAISPSLGRMMAPNAASIVSQPSMAPSLLPSAAPSYVYPASTAGDPLSLPITDSMSAPKLVLKPEVGGGLKVSLCFRRSSLHYAAASTSFSSDVFQVVLSVTNCRENPIR